MTVLWRRMSFLQKVSARNVFRYKKRLVMMLLGVGGCLPCCWPAWASGIPWPMWRRISTAPSPSTTTPSPLTKIRLRSSRRLSGKRRPKTSPTWPSPRWRPWRCSPKTASAACRWWRRTIPTSPPSSASPTTARRWPGPRETAQWSATSSCVWRAFRWATA